MAAIARPGREIVTDGAPVRILSANGLVATRTATAFAAENTRIVTLRGTRGHLDRGRLAVYGFPPEGFRPADPFPEVTHGHEIAFAAGAARLGGALVTRGGAPAGAGGRA